MNSLDANFYEVHPKIMQTPRKLSREELAEALLARLPLQMGRELQDAEEGKAFRIHAIR